jgi:hypothetical protein
MSFSFTFAKGAISATIALVLSHGSSQVVGWCLLSGFLRTPGHPDSATPDPGRSPGRSVQTIGWSNGDVTPYGYMFDEERGDGYSIEPNGLGISAKLQFEIMC